MCRYEVGYLGNNARYISKGNALDFQAFVEGECSFLHNQVVLIDQCLGKLSLLAFTSQ